MAINIDLTETQNPESAGTFRRVAPGPVHLQVIDVQENGGKNGEHVVKFEVLMHNDHSQVGATHTEMYPATANMTWKVLGLCYAVKIADRAAMKRAKDAGVSHAPVDLQAAVGRQLFAVVKVTEKTDNGAVKTYSNLDSPLAIDDEAAKNFPRNVNHLAQAGLSQPAATMPVQTSAPVANPFASLT